ncbi:uncharacterized protein [Clytia hemisphaerica]
MPSTRSSNQQQTIEWSLVVYHDVTKSGRRIETQSIVPSHWVSQSQTILYWPDTLNVESRKHEHPSCDWFTFDVLKIKFTGSKEECVELEGAGYTTAAEESGNDRDASMDSPTSVDFNNDNSNVLMPSTEMTSLFSNPSMASSSKASSEAPKSSVSSLKRHKSFANLSLASIAESATAPVSLPNLNRQKSFALPSKASIAESSQSSVSLPSLKRQKSFAVSKTSIAESATAPVFLPTPKSQKSFANHSMTSNAESPNASASHSTPRNNSIAHNYKFPMENGRFQKKVLSLLTKILEVVRQSPSTGPSSSRPHDLHQFTTISEFMEHENDPNQNKHLSMIESLKYIGGKDCKEATKNSMLRVMTYKLMSEFNMCGTVKSNCEPKRRFKDTKVFQAVRKAVVDSGKGTEDDVYNAMIDVLKFAPDKHGGSGRKRKSPPPQHRPSPSQNEVSLPFQDQVSPPLPKRFKMFDDDSDSESD